MSLRVSAMKTTINVDDDVKTRFLRLKSKFWVMSGQPRQPTESEIVETMVWLTEMILSHKEVSDECIREYLLRRN